MKVAVLGGGVGAMTAAFWLTNPPELGGPVEKCDVTVYQMGWRLGGKGASGRNMEKACRIEEHGLHIWMGFYANAFRMMRAVYGELNRPKYKPLATWQEAFKPQTVITMMEKGPDENWLPEWIVSTPLRPGDPGDQTSFPPPWGYLPRIQPFIRDQVDDFLKGHSHDACPPHELPAAHLAHLLAVRTALSEACGHAEGTSGAVGGDRALWLCLKGAQTLIGDGLDRPDNCLGVRRLLMLCDMGVAIALGILKDLNPAPWESIDDKEWRTWLSDNGMHPVSVNGSLTRAMYDLVFGYEGGVVSDKTASLAAGTTTCAVMRILFDYYTALFMKMQAGMGDAIFAPIYEVLRKRGVTFKYFHRLREVVPAADGTSIDELRIGVQATPWPGTEYNPLVDVQQLPCWPSTPLYGQLQQGEELLRLGQDLRTYIDLEKYDTPWKDVGEVVLKQGTDFDVAVFGLSLGAVPFVCPQLLAQKPAWKAMVENVKVVRTQAFQLWLSRDVADLGWPPALNGRCFGERAVLGTFVEPLDTWADMSQLIPREAWNPAVPMNNISYFCGVLPDDAVPSDDTARENARGILDHHIGALWTNAAPGGKFRYDWLSVNDPGTFTDEERFRDQFFRVNVEPTEKYVLSVASSTKYRLDPAKTGYSNLVLAGDWVRNGLAIGCVESGVLGGMKGVQPYCPGMQIVEQAGGG
jgi:uncharacterized protein with NAD-binding domain and iron-sulfur cluster